MTTIILTIIGILLAAAAALMVIFYGGNAFNSGTVGAQANQLQNAGTNVVSAVQMFKAENATAPANVAELLTVGVGGAYLDELPALPEGLTGGEYAPATKLYTVDGVSDEVCARVNGNLDVDTQPADTSAPATLPKMGCAADGTFFARA